MYVLFLFIFLLLLIFRLKFKIFPILALVINQKIEHTFIIYFINILIKIMSHIFNSLLLVSIIHYTILCTGITIPHKQSLYRNPIYPSIFVNKWWRDLGKPILTIGIHGVKPSHLNYIADNIWHNHLMKIKTSSNKVLSPLQLGEQLAISVMQSPLGEKIPIEIILIKGREVMIGKLKASMELLSLWDRVS